MVSAYPTAREQGRLAPLKFEHAGLRTARLNEMVDWYCAVLEADVAFRSDRIAFLSFDEQNHRLAIIARPGIIDRPGDAAGLDHLAFTYANLGELAATYTRLKSRGIVPGRATDHGSSTSFYYSDPDGNHIELKVDTFPTQDEQHEWLRSAAFAENPAGEPIDPETICNRT